MAEVREVTVPDIGDFTDVPVIEILVKPGEELGVDEPMVTLESDKATMDVPAPFAGKVVKLKVGVGDTVSEGVVIATMEHAEAAGLGSTEEAPVTSAIAAEEMESDEDAVREPDEADDAGRGAEEAESAPGRPSSVHGSAPSESARLHAAESPPTDTASSSPAYASPAVRKLAREREVDLGKVKGSGRKGRITKEDVEAAAKKQGVEEPKGALPFEIAPWPKVDYAKYGPVDRVPLSRIKKISGPNVARNWVAIPHVTHNDEADITDLEAFRKQINGEQDEVKVTMVSLLVKACVSALKKFPDFNSSLDGDELILKRYYNIGFAADTPQGLLVPVIKDADKKGLLEIAADLTELSGKARDGKIGPAEMAGGTFSISSLGGIGGTSFTPIVNAPEVAILGVTRAAMRPTWNGSEFVPRLIVPLSLSYDHRVIDGAAGARFTAFLVSELTDFRRVLL